MRYPVHTYIHTHTYIYIHTLTHLHTHTPVLAITYATIKKHIARQYIRGAIYRAPPPAPGIVVSVKAEVACYRRVA